VRGGDSPDMRATLEARLIALARAHGVLMERNWKGADLRETVDRALDAFVGNGDNRLRLEGPPIDVSPKVALALAMALQELTTNAIKYGALSNGTGHVNVSWTVWDKDPPVLHCGGRKAADRRSSRRAIKGSARVCSSVTSRRNLEAKWTFNTGGPELSARSTSPFRGR
jgi:two-component sensor histidine kinase